MTRDEVLLKVTKLLRLADRSRNMNEAEAMLAMEKAKRLMDDYNLSLGEIADADGESNSKTPQFEVGEAAIVELKRSMNNWEHILSRAVSIHCNSMIFLRRIPRHGKAPIVKICFIGDLVEVAIGKELYQVLWDTTMAGAREVNGPGYGFSHRTYCEGFSIRVLERVREMRDRRNQDHTQVQQSSLALVLRSKEDAIAQYAAINLQLKPARASGGSGRVDPASYAAGRAHGDRVSLDKRGLK